MTPGTRIGSYEIVALIGAGGMGEVYRARDTKLKREVALKVLPAAFAENPERMARFQREAEVLALLNHPNIAHIYCVEENALVMELAEGASPKGPMSFEDAWKIASQIAEALEYAHERGVIHRDLKPANVKVTPDGVVKLLDFGLAKALSEEVAPASAGEDSPTLTMGPTVAGVILGTAAYMAPEQAKGKKLDKRADIWSFGVVLYELLTGERMFQGEDVVDTLAAVLHKQPDLERVPVKVRRLLGECLQKDPKLRLRDIGDAKRLLEEPVEPAVLPPAKARAAKLPWALAALGISAALALAFVHFREAPAQRAVLRYTIATPENTTNLHSFAISPDGHYVAIAAEVSGKRQLWLRSLDELQAQPIPFTDDARFPFWSPDSRYIAFFAQDKLKKIAISGGPAQSLCNVPDGRGGSWNGDGVIVFTPAPAGAIEQVSASSGVRAAVAGTKDRSRYPVFLPDGRHFLYVVLGGSLEGNDVYLGSLDGHESRRVLTDAIGAIFAAGRLLFIRENTLLAQPFDAQRGQTTGEAVPVADGVSVTTNADYAPITVSETGVLLYERGGLAGGRQMAWYDRSGKLIEAVGAPGAIFGLAISPDEKTVAFSRNSVSGSDLWLRDLSRGAEQRFTTDASFNVSPNWSPKGDRIVFASTRGGGSAGIYQRDTSGTGQDEPLLASGHTKRPTQWSRDGRFIVYSEQDPKTRWDIWVLPIRSGEQPKPFPVLHSDSNETFGQLSPDNHWMAYTSDESGQLEVYVRPFPGGQFQRRISIAGGQAPRWRGDGKELFFEGADGKIMAVAVKAAFGANPSFEPGAPLPLFDAHLSTGIAGRQLFGYDVTADGKRFLLVTSAGGPASAPLLNVVVNWNVGLGK